MWTRLKRFFLLAAFVNALSAGASLASEECDVPTISNMVKAISILRQIENSLNFLALSQVDAIVDIATGVHTLELYNDESGFYGPLGGLRKATDKNETVLSSLDKAIRRLGVFDTFEKRYTEIQEHSARIVAAGYDVLAELEAGDTAEATRVYASATVIALNKTRADAYTIMSGFERTISLAGVRCR